MKCHKSATQDPNVHTATALEDGIASVHPTSCPDVHRVTLHIRHMNVVQLYGCRLERDHGRDSSDSRQVCGGTVDDRSVANVETQT